MSTQNPVIVIPGFTASQLQDQYPVSPDTVWSLARHEFARVALHPDDLRYERLEPARVTAEKVFTVPYGEFIADLRHGLSRSPDEQTPIFPFEYDWRQPLERTQEVLADFVDEVIGRTALLRHYKAWATDPHVDLVGHSMGGLVIASYLDRYKTAARVGKVITLGTPFRGSFEAALKITTGLAELGQDKQTSSERDAARMTPALYQLLPEFPGALHVDPGLPASLFEHGVWQDAVVQTIAEHIKAYGLRPENAPQQARTVFSGLLQQAQSHRARMDAFTLQSAGLDDSRWLCIVGVDAKTRVRLKVTRDDEGRPLFDLTSKDRMNRYQDNNPAKRIFTGDGTVPYLGAVPAFLPRERLVCVSPKDFGYWEFTEQAVSWVASFHGALPKMNLINRLSVAFLLGKSGGKGLWGRAAPDLADPDAWDPPIANLDRRSP